MMKILIKLAILLILFNCMVLSQEWQSKLVYYDTNNKLVYKSDNDGFILPDFSYAGYMKSEKEIPNVPVVKTISPVAGDNTASIQSAIDYISSLSPDQNGIRGAVLLTQGVYDVYGTISIKQSGIILRGVGRSADSTKNTVIFGRGDSPHQRTILSVGGGSSTPWVDEVQNTRTNIQTDSVKFGDKKFIVSDVSKYQVGDNIIIVHPCTQNWLEAIDFGGTEGSAPWTVNEQPIIFNRIIEKIVGNEIVFDAPVFYPLIKSLAQSYIYKYDKKDVKNLIGIENLRIEIETLGGTDENHAWNAIEMYELENSWCKNLTISHFGFAGIETACASQITIDSCNSIDPISIIEGGKRYNFCLYRGSTKILFKNCYARNGRHHFVSNGTSSVSGNVFYNCTSENAYASSEGHRRWSVGLLYDNIKEINPKATIILGLYNRGNYGTSHGWASAFSIAWNCNVSGKTIIIQKPPTAQNYAIGCFGTVAGTNPPAPFNHPEGYIEGTNKLNLKPTSLYLAQFQERMKSSHLDEKEDKTNLKGFNLYQNYPNPFNGSTKITFSLNKTSKIQLFLFDSLGRKIAELINEEKSAGEYEHLISFDGLNLSGGIYFFQLSDGNTSLTKKTTYLK